MAVSHWGVNAPEAVKLWSRKTMRETLRKTYYARFTGKNSNSLVQIKEDTAKSKGDRIRCTLRLQGSGDGRQGDATLEGHEEALSTHTDDTVIDQLRHAFRSGGEMSEQRVPFDVREELRMAVEDWWTDRLDTWFFNQISGNTSQSDTRYTGNQAAIAPDSDHHIFAGSATAESNVSGNSSQIFSLAVVDRLVLRAKTLDIPMRPVKGGGASGFVMFISPEQHFDLRRNSTSQEYADFQKAAIQGGQVTKNPMFTGAVGMWNGVVIHEADRLPSFTVGANAAGNAVGYRAVLCGAQAAVMAFGGGYGLKRMSWKEELFDYENQLGVAAGMIAGLKKQRYNSKDFSTIVCSTAVSDDALAASARV